MKYSNVHYKVSSMLNDIIPCGSGFEHPKVEPYNANGDARYSLHIVVSGKGKYSINGNEYYLKKGQMFALFPEIDIVYEPDAKSPWSYYWIDFLGEKSNEILQLLNITPDTPIIDTHDKFTAIKKLFQDNIEQCEEYPSLVDFVTISKLFAIFCELSMLDGMHGASTTNQKRIKYVDDAIDIIRRDYANSNLTMASVAQYLCIDPAYLSRIFKKHTGVNFNAYLGKIRMQAAIDLMDQGCYSIKDVAHMAGYSDALYFSNVFKRYNGISPTEHIERIRAKKSQT